MGQIIQSGDQVLSTVGRDLRRKMEREIRRTGITARALLLDDPRCPKDLNSGAVNRWIAGVVKQAPKAHLDYVLAKWAALPDDAGRTAFDGKLASPATTSEPTWIPLQPKMGRWLRDELDRTGANGKALLDRASNVPPGLTAITIEGWFFGEVRSINADHWVLVTTLLAHMDTDSFVPKLKIERQRIGRQRHPLIPDADRAILRAHRDRTGIGGAILLNGAGDKPDDLTPAMISAWLTGRAKKADPGHLAYVIARYAQFPDNLRRS